LTAWRRIIFPDGTNVDLDTMPSGYAGFKDLVDDHYWTLFKDAMLVSMFSAGIQLSQSQAANGQNISNQQVMAAAIGQELGQVGMEVARRDLDIQPTIEIRPGYQFNIMVNKDMVMPAWADPRETGKQ
jgi:type IV secretion system protein VirB10